MREVVENKADISKQEARDLVERCLKVLYYRDARSYNRVSSAHVSNRTQSRRQTPTELNFNQDLPKAPPAHRLYKATECGKKHKLLEGSYSLLHNYYIHLA